MRGIRKTPGRASRVRLSSRPPGRTGGLLPACLLAFLALLSPALGHGDPQRETAGPGRGLSLLKGPNVELTGAPDKEVSALLTGSAWTFTHAKDLPRSEILLKNRAQADMKRMIEVLRSLGYFKAEIALSVSLDRVLFALSPGPRFSYGDVQVVAQGGDQAPLLPSPVDLGLLEGSPYRAEDVLEARRRLLTFLGDHGYPFPEMEAMTVVADHADTRVGVTFLVCPGPRARFGSTRILGLERLDPDYALGLIPWREGQSYDASAVDRGRSALLRSGLYTLVEIEKAEGPEDDGRLPMTVQVRERLPRTISAGVEYTTDFGPGFNVGWENRNLYGRAENLSLSLSMNTDRQEMSGRFLKPGFLREDQTFILGSALRNEDTDAYRSRSWDTSALVERRFQEDLLMGAGLGFRQADVRKTGEPASRAFSLLYLPVTVTWDTRDAPLDPRRGYLLSALAAPWKDVTRGDIHFFKFRTTAALYRGFAEEDRVSFAAKASFGQILGEDMENVPADLRFYGGGGGSVRGFRYQFAGDVTGGSPVGGRSILELSCELRVRIDKTLGIVPFLDAGRAYEGVTPDLGLPLFYGAGIGLRYFTDFGPLRLDVGIPLNPRKGVDDAFQVYISIGQAF